MDTKTKNTIFSSKSNEWTTPQDFYDKLNDKYEFTLDPCCTSVTKKCTKYYTEQDNGLSKDWAGETVFVNPPYGNVKEWIEKAAKEAETVNTKVVMLTPARTDTRVWHDTVFSKAKEIYFVKGRLKFGEQSNSAPFPSAVIVFHNVRSPFIHYPVVGTMER